MLEFLTVDAYKGGISLYNVGDAVVCNDYFLKHIGFKRLSSNELDLVVYCPKEYWNQN